MVRRNNLILILSCGCAIAFLSFGPRAVMGLFLLPMTETRDWSREIFSLAIAIQNLIWGIGQPLAGMVADRLGVARVMITGAILYAAGLYLMTVVGSPSGLYMTAGIMVGLGISCSSFSLVMAAFGRFVSAERRMLAFGLATAAGSAGQFIYSPFSQNLINSGGWQFALIILSGLCLLIMVLCVPLRGRQKTARDAQSDIGEQSLSGVISAAFAHRSYQLLVLGFFVCGFQLSFITVHLQPYLVERGVSPQLGAWAIGIIGLFNIVGSLAAGYIGGKYSKSYFLSLIYLSRALAFIIFISLPTTPVSVGIFAIVIGLLWLSTVPPTSGLVATMFGTRYMATLFGFVFFSHQIGSFMGVWLGGKLFDATGSYLEVWWLTIALGVLSALLHLPIKDRPAPRLAI